jgi:hypothetical protein
MEQNISRIAIKLTIDGLGEAKGELIRHLAPRTIDALTRKMPLEGRAALWRNAVHFEVPIKMGTEKPKDTAKRGTMAYWPMGNAFCIFYDETRPHSPVNIIGQITENLEVFRQVKGGTKIRAERI